MGSFLKGENHAGSNRFRAKELKIDEEGCQQRSRMDEGRDVSAYAIGGHNLMCSNEAVS